MGEKGGSDIIEQNEHWQQELISAKIILQNYASKYLDSMRMVDVYTCILNISMTHSSIRLTRPDERYGFQLDFQKLNPFAVRRNRFQTKFSVH